MERPARSVVCAAVLTVVWAVSVVTAQTKVSTVADFRKAMITVADAFGVIEWAASSNVYLLNSVRGNAITQLATARLNIVALQAFFAAKKKDDAVVFAEGTLATLDALNRILAAAEPDEAAAAEAAEEVRDTCNACHKVYREGDAQTGFRFRAGML